jgi:23S rRNA (cytidine1920-2'-O)/16S rRNA (cytidine1409-2'-O)-methyltransferase
LDSFSHPKIIGDRRAFLTFQGSRTKNRVRIDLRMVELKLAETREKARAMIMAGLVLVDGVKVEKPGLPVSPSSRILVKTSLPFVSRGGMKLDAALTAFSVDVRDKVILDVGASTGGFTDCLLQRGAGKLIAVDVGYGQLHWKLRRDPRVVILERTNIRNLDADMFKEKADGAVIDVSFISLKLVIPVVSRLLKDQAFIVALVKPQFEVGKGRVGKGGVVRDPALHEEVLEGIVQFCETEGWEAAGRIASPLLGPKGNKEFLVYLKRELIPTA